MATVARRALDDYLTQPYRITFARAHGEGGWTASVDELPGCRARDETREKAAAAVRQAMREWIEAALAEGREIPSPRGGQSFSGRLLLRMPSSLHADLSRAAEEEGTSLNQFIVAALSRSLTGPPTPDAVDAQTLSAPTPQPPRLLGLALVVNLVAVLVAAGIAVALLVVAWHGGF